MTKDLGKLWAERMTGSERDKSFPDSEPRDAATLMLIDRSGPMPKVLLGRRHAGQNSCPASSCFRAGASRRSTGDDRGQRNTSRRAEEIAERVASRTRNLRARLRLPPCARRPRKPACCSAVARDRPPVMPGEIWTEFAKANVHPDLGQIHFIARAITPPRRPRRFDTRFFTADASAIAHKIEGVVGPDSELVELAWVPIEEANALDMPTITGIVLEELLARVEAGMGHDLPVPFYFMVGPAVLPGTAVNAAKCRAFLDICRFGARFRAKAPTSPHD